ncbi:MAG: hypothetical protein HGA71_08505 [Azonexaceae bacterium]|nr:hypothetical protein [Azonexaceae bacterium]
MINDLIHQEDVLAVNRFPVSTAATFRSPVFLPWIKATDIMIRDYETQYRPWRKVDVIDRKGNQIESIEIDKPLWRRHKNFLNALFSNIVPIPLENGGCLFVYSANWMATKLGYEQPNKRLQDVDQIASQIKRTTINYRLKNRPGVSEVNIFDKTTRITGDDVEKYGLPAEASGMRSVIVSPDWIELIKSDQQVVMMPETAQTIAQIPDGAWQSIVEIALSHKDFFNQRLETSKDGETIGAIELIGFKKALMSKSAYSKQRKNLITQSESSDMAARLTGVVIEEGADGFVVRRIDQHNKVGHIYISDWT